MTTIDNMRVEAVYLVTDIERLMSTLLAEPWGAKGVKPTLEVLWQVKLKLLAHRYEMEEMHGRAESAGTDQ